MKNLILALSLFHFFNAQSQVFTSLSETKKLALEPGVYKSESKSQNIKLTLNEDKTYDMSFMYGNYEVKMILFILIIFNKR